MGGKLAIESKVPGLYVLCQFPTLAHPQLSGFCGPPGRTGSLDWSLIDFFLFFVKLKFKRGDFFFSKNEKLMVYKYQSKLCKKNSSIRVADSSFNKFSWLIFLTFFLQFSPISAILSQPLVRNNNQ